MKKSIMIDQIIRSRRRTLSLEITPDARLIIRAPRHAKMKDIEECLRKKKRWIEVKQKLFTQRRLEAGRYQQEILPLIPAYKKDALAKITERVKFYAEKTGLKYKSIAISNALHRWGSCSPKGRLRFTWRLMLAPLEVIDYVAVHELAHLEHKNHSRAFWSKVRQILPDYKKSAAWLKDNQHLLSFRHISLDEGRLAVEDNTKLHDGSEAIKL